jgi:hypothetical protein
MSRKHLFAIVVLLGAAAVAALLAMSRATTSAAPASSAQIVAKTQSLDRLEASLRRALAERPPAVPATQRSATRPAQTVYLRSGATVRTPVRDGEHEHADDGHESGRPEGIESFDD